MFGIIGYPLLHTFSPDYFNAKFAQSGLPYTYHKFPLATIDELKTLIIGYPDLKGLNVTIPYKQSVIPFLNELDNTAKAVGAVNTIVIKNGKLKGYNTDVIGFTDSLKPLLQAWHNKALILGTGGASRAVAYSLLQFGISFQFVSRHPKEGRLTYSDLDPAIIEEHKLIINTTPLGMSPDTDTCPDIPYEWLTPRHLLYDLVYTPAETLFLLKGKEKGAVVQNGYDMLIGQAEASWHIWNDIG